MAMSAPTRFRFGPFVCDARDRVLLRGAGVADASEDAGAPLALVAITPKVLDTLVVLLEHASQVLTRGDLMKAVWPDTNVEEGSLTRNISALRRALGDDTGTPVYIETLPKRGYRFAAAVGVERSTVKVRVAE
jgi:DNA-binding winged helix-turn-helix (wHTH) protein